MTHLDDRRLGGRSRGPRRRWTPRRLLRRLPLAGATILAGSSPQAVLGQELAGDGLPVREIVLENGMRVLVLPRPGAPTVSFVVQYEVGGVNERPGTTGVAHLLEHMLFKGTTTIGTRDLEAEIALQREMDLRHDSLTQSLAATPPDSALSQLHREAIDSLEAISQQYVISNEFNQILSNNGARSLNATTTNESTMYFVELPANRIELWFVLESDRMRNPVFREFYRERDVVMEERRLRVETNPAGMLYEAHLGTAFTRHPYGRPVVGYMSDLRTHSRLSVADYYARYYGPNNAVVAIVGDVEPARVEQLALRYFGSIPRGEEPPPIDEREPPQRGERRIDVELDAEPRVRWGWHTVDAFHDDMPALVVLTSLLTGGRTSRLYRRLVLDDRLATQVTSSLGPGSRFPQLFQIDAIPRSPHTTEELEAAVERELQALATAPPTAEELERVGNQIRAGTVRRLQSNLGLAFQLAESASLYGDWRTTFVLGERLRAVTPEDVQGAVQRYLRPANRTVATLVKRPSETGAGGSR